MILPPAPATPRSIAAPALYAIADTDSAGLDGALSVVRTAAREGVEWIQLRAKQVSDRELFDLATRAVDSVAGTDARLWVDDRADIAALLPVAGVHLGQLDLPPATARRIVGPEKWIGQSTHSRDQVVTAIEDSEVDVVAVGPIFPTRSKSDPDPVVGLDLVRWARERTEKPLVAIGGIGAANAREVLEAGANSVVALGAICRGDVAANCKTLLNATTGAGDVRGSAHG